MVATTRNAHARATAKGWFQFSGAPVGAWEAVCAIATLQSASRWFAMNITPTAEERERGWEPCDSGAELCERALEQGWRLLSDWSSATRAEISEVRQRAGFRARVQILRAVATLEETFSAD